MVNKDEVAGKAEQLKGKVKQKTGALISDPDLEAEGVGDQVAGKVRETVGTVKRKTEEVVNKVTKPPRERR
ncbi:MAG: CsbD family protein [Vicinamibacterales bacterium]|nr:CsbD family protein [Vicinamibacterales bacterium]